jgi:hypothetical protein
MKKNSLSNTGLSLSQAQSISNLCFQRAKDIDNELRTVNNVQKELKINGETYVETVGKKLPVDTIQLLVEKSKLHACQAFLMENIKAKDQMITELQREHFVYNVEEPESPNHLTYQELPLVNEVWGWSQLSVSEYNEYLESEAYASHIGQFIHKDGKLDFLRRELPSIKTLEWITIKDGEKTPLKVTIHHTQSELTELHENLASMHRKYEQRVNYFKAKVKNLVTEENARLSKENSVKIAEVIRENEKMNKEFNVVYTKFLDEKLKSKQDFETTRQEKIKEAASLRIQVDARFQEVIDEFLNKLS